MLEGGDSAKLSEKLKAGGGREMFPPAWTQSDHLFCTEPVPCDRWKVGTTALKRRDEQSNQTQQQRSLADTPVSLPSGSIGEEALAPVRCLGD